jgi:DNA-binding response OmpR family regulator
LDILVVDDDEPLRAMLTRSFEREGHRVTAVADGDAAITQATEHDFDVVQGLEAGADDYVTKPFGLAELRSRIRAVLRRAHGRVVDGVRTVGPVTIDQRERQVTVGGSPVRVTFSEYELLACLMERPGKLFTRQELLRAIWGDSAYRDPRAIDVHIRHLREKLEERPEEPSLILTVRGAGYRFREQ